MRRHTLEQLARRPGVLQRLDARTKTACALLLILFAVLLPAEATWPALAYLLLILALSRLAGLPLGALLLRVAWIGPFVLAAAVLLPFIPRPGSRVLLAFSLAGRPAAVYHEGLVLLKAMLLKAGISVSTVLLLSATTTFDRQLAALASFRLPRLGLTVLALLYRYLFLLQDEFARVTRAAAARNWSSGRPALRLRAAGGLLGSLFLRTYARGERVHAAMLARGWEGGALQRGCGPYRRAELLPAAGFAVFTAGVFAAARLL
jgi:cobalt/nickel transport system permease protein